MCGKTTAEILNLWLLLVLHCKYKIQIGLIILYNAQRYLKTTKNKALTTYNFPSICETLLEHTVNEWFGQCPNAISKCSETSKRMDFKTIPTYPRSSLLFSIPLWSTSSWMYCPVEEAGFNADHTSSTWDVPYTLCAEWAENQLFRWSSSVVSSSRSLKENTYSRHELDFAK